MSFGRYQSGWGCSILKNRIFLRVFWIFFSMFASLMAFAQSTKQANSFDSFSVVSFTLNAHKADFLVIHRQLLRVGQIDLWGFVDVHPSWEKNLKQVFPVEKFEWVVGSSGQNQRLMLAIRKEKFTLVRQFELHQVNPEGKGRSPLVAEIKSVSSGLFFYLMVNHLQASDQIARIQEAKAINVWASEQPMPVVAIGNYHFNWSLLGGARDAGFNEMGKRDVFDWVIPKKLIPTHCDANAYILDFIWVSGGAQKWHAEADILFPQPAYCPDARLKSDHRPIKAVFWP